MEGKEISRAVIKRLPRYHRYLDGERNLSLRIAVITIAVFSVPVSETVVVRISVVFVFMVYATMGVAVVISVCMVHAGKYCGGKCQ